MSISQSFLLEIDQEMAKTRTSLERVPKDRADFAPHEKSMTLGKLAMHLAEMVGWGADTLTSTEFDVSPPDGPAYQSPTFTTREELLAIFDANLERLRSGVAKLEDDAWAEIWTLKGGDQVYFSMPRGAVMRVMILNHLIHHRAQLGVYLRLLGVPVPAIYGPTADEQ